MSGTSQQNKELAADIAAYLHNPLGYVLYAFPWDTEGTELEGMAGPEDWQREVLTAIGEALENGESFEPILESIASGHGIGKALKIDDFVPTVKGLRRVGEIDTSDILFGQHGQRVRVLATKSYKNIPFYRVTFSDRSSVEVSSGHLWKTKNRQDRRAGKDWQVLSTLDILNAGVKRPNGVTQCKQWEIPQQGIVHYPSVKHEVDAYTYGVWLGDGDKASGRITNLDQEVWDNVKYSSKGEGLTRTLYGLKVALRENGLSGCTTYNASVDRKYIESKERLQVLQGLLDTDGWVEACGSAAFCSASKQLVTDVVEIARSLGLMAKEPKYKANECAGAWLTHITWDGITRLFKIKRKQNRLIHAEERYQKRWIESIEFLEMSDGVCFEVEGNLFLTKDYHVTHNSALVSWIIMWGLSTMMDTKMVITANTENQLKTKTWAELAKWHRLAINSHWFKYTATAVFSTFKQHEKTWRADMIPWSEHKTEAFAGLHNKGKRIIVIFDEASAIPDVIWEVTEGALTDEETEIIWLVCGNPTRNTGRFHACFNKFRHRWLHMQVDSRSVSLTNKTQIQKWADDYGDDSDFFRVRVKGQFPNSSSNQMIPTSIVEAAMSRHLKEADYNFAPIILGLDRAWSGDTTRLWMRQGNFARRLATFNRGEDDIIVAGHVAMWEDRLQADAVFMDFGYATGVFSAGKTMKRNWQMINFGGAAVDQQYANKRVEMWANMRDWLKEGGTMPQDDRMFTDLISPEAYEVVIGKNAGKLIMESKKDMLKRGIDSPDDGDALCVTFALPVKTKREKRFHAAIASQQLEYDPLETAQVQAPVYYPTEEIAHELL